MQNKSTCEKWKRPTFLADEFLRMDTTSCALMSRMTSMNNEGNAVIYLNPSDRLDERDTRDTSDPHPKKNDPNDPGDWSVDASTRDRTLTPRVTEIGMDPLFFPRFSALQRGRNNILASRIEAVSLTGMKRADERFSLCVWRLTFPCDPSMKTISQFWHPLNQADSEIFVEEMQMSYV